MKYQKTEITNVLARYQKFYQKINGGIDGYYESVIINADLYEVIENNPIACFSVDNERGLTSLVLYSDSNIGYDQVFDYVIGLPLFNNLLFTENDLSFLRNVSKHSIKYEIQAYNFEVSEEITSQLNMQVVTKEDVEEIMTSFGDFIRYNKMDLINIKSFYLKIENKLISFGALEPLKLNSNRYCISMIVSEDERGKGYGSETVKHLIQYLQANKLEVNARCYVLNESSKRTLLKSGMKISNRLYKAEKFKD